MERSEYYKLDRLEDRMWWFAAGHRNLLTLSWRQVPLKAKGQPILDAGCGTGGFLAQLAAHYPNRALFGLDVDPLACRRASARAPARYVSDQSTRFPSLKVYLQQCLVLTCCAIALSMSAPP